MRSNTDVTYINMLKYVLHSGEQRQDRTGTGTYSVFGYQSRYDIDMNAFPVLTTKYIHLPAVVHELLWFLSGSTSIDYLKKHGIKIWDAWADSDNSVGPMYGYQWRKWEQNDVLYSRSADDKLVSRVQTTCIDQIDGVIESIKRDPFSRRHVVTAWNPGQLEEMALAPCHVMFQFYVTNDGKLSCHMFQRSADVFLGVPFNITSYALLAAMIAKLTGYVPGELVHSVSDLHLYANHVDAASEQIRRFDSMASWLPAPKLVLADKAHIDSFTYDDIKFVGYRHQGKITAPIAV